MNKNIVLCGVGGQGTVLASKLIAAAAMNKDLPVMSAETIGMAQRGGSVFSHVRIGKNAVSPMIAHKEADIIIGFEPGEAVRMLPFLKDGGTVITSSRAISPVTATLTGSSYNGGEMLDYLKKHIKNLFVIDTQKACSEIGSPKALNTLLLGAAVQSGALGLSEEDMKKAVISRLPEKFHALNFSALEYVRRHSS
ncbi:MAG: indolepyruvate oxidoreductase subunit beta [Dorea sp.]|nr:indolepyruvate oxidoreductase subunit beta [Dorea sp.]